MLKIDLRIIKAINNKILYLVSNYKAERTCTHICVKSASGKSYFNYSAQYMKEYKKKYPKLDIFDISSIKEYKPSDISKPISLK